MPAPFLEQLVRARMGDLLDRWYELCRWDPALPPESAPVMAEHVVAAMIGALDRPQPLAMGLDPALEAIVDEFALASESAEIAAAQLVCLREAFDQIVIADLPDREDRETIRRLDMVTHRAIIAVTQVEIERLRASSLTDSLTGMLNRRAFDQDLRRARAHYQRLGEPFSLAMIDLVGLKLVNDTHGHLAGDTALRRMADAIRATTRADDRGYRIGGDEFAIVLPNAVLADPSALVERLEQARAPSFTLGVASVPGDDVDRLLEIADRRLYEARRVSIDT